MEPSTSAPLAPTNSVSASTVSSPRIPDSGSGSGPRSPQEEAAYLRSLYLLLLLHHENTNRQRLTDYWQTVNPKQTPFHQSQAWARIFKGANRCLTADTPVLRPDGSTTPIVDLREGDVVLAFDPLQNVAVPSPVVARYENGRRAVVQYTFGRYRTAHTLTATSHHRLWSELLVGGSTPRRGVRSLGRLALSHRASVLRPGGGQWGVPEPKALLLGLLLGDGYLAGSSIQWTCADDDLAAFVSSYVQSLGFGLSRAVDPIQYRVTDRVPVDGARRDGAGRWAQGSVTSESRLKRWLADLGVLGARSREKTLPRAVWTWDQASVAAFVAGYLAADGSAFTTREGCAHVTLSSASRPLLSEVRRLMEVRLGIYGSTLLEQHDRGYQVSYGTAEALRRLAALPVPGRKGRGLRTLPVVPQRRGSRASRLLLKGSADAGSDWTFDIQVAHPAHLFVLDGGLVVSNSGKSVAGGVEALLWLTGTHPYRETPRPPIIGRCVCPQLPLTLDQMHVQRDEVIKAWCPAHMLRGGSWESAYSVVGHTLHFENGSLLEFLSSEQDPQVHAGAGRDFCFDAQTQVLSDRGWIGQDNLVPGDLLYTLNMQTGRMEWKSVTFVYRRHHRGPMVRLRRLGAKGRLVFDALVTPGHAWPVVNLRTRALEMRTTESLRTYHAFLRAAPPGWDTPETYDDNFVRLVAWVLTEGSISKARGTVTLSQSKHREAIRALGGVGQEVVVAPVASQHRERSLWNVVGPHRRAVRALLGSDKNCPMPFLLALSRRQLTLFYETLLDGDGHRAVDRTGFTQKTRPHIADLFEIVCALLGKATRTHRSDEAMRVWVQTGKRCGPRVRVANVTRETVPYDDLVWCPHTENGTVVARRNGIVYLSGNCWFDEEMPRIIYTENLARLSDQGRAGAWWMTYTPILGLTWIEKEVYEVALRHGGVRHDPEWFLVEATIWDNRANLREGFIDQFASTLLPWERAVRLEGKYGQRQGLVYDLFGAAHVGDFGVEVNGDRA